jgi:hypothetical protein
MPDKVIKQVHRLASRQKLNLGLVFLNRDRQPHTNLEDYHYSDDDDEDYMSVDGNNDEDD